MLTGILPSPTIIMSPIAGTTHRRVALLGVCTSMKPVPGLPNRSAARQYLRAGLEALSDSGTCIGLLDLRENPVQFFDGRNPVEITDTSFKAIYSAISDAESLILSVPCYWGGVSGVFKNFIDCMCGALYDLHGAKPVLCSKRIGLFIVGADSASARNGAAQAEVIMNAVGAILIGRPVIIENPRQPGIKPGKIIESLATLGRELLI